MEQQSQIETIESLENILRRYESLSYRYDYDPAIVTDENAISDSIVSDHQSRVFVKGVTIC